MEIKAPDAEIPNPKYQIPNKSQVQNHKIQRDQILNHFSYRCRAPGYKYCGAPHLDFGDWDLLFVWDLVLGIWNLTCYCFTNFPIITVFSSVIFT